MGKRNLERKMKKGEREKTRTTEERERDLGKGFALILNFTGGKNRYDDQLPRVACEPIVQRCWLDGMFFMRYVISDSVLLNLFPFHKCIENGFVSNVLGYFQPGVKNQLTTQYAST